MSQILIKDIVRQLKELQDGSLWFDQSFKGKINGLSAEEAFTRPIPELHSAAEHISHCLEWRKECLRMFNGQQTDLLHSPDDWKDNATLQKTGWENLKNLFYESTDTLIRTLEKQDDGFLKNIFAGTDYTFHCLIEGIIQHDLYHLGQTGITIKLLNKNGR